MKAFIIELDDKAVPEAMEMLEKLPENEISVQSLDSEVDEGISVLKDRIAYLQALLDKREGNAVDLEDYMRRRKLV